MPKKFGWGLGRQPPHSGGQKNLRLDFGLLCGKNNNLSGERPHLRAKIAKNFGTAQASYKCTPARVHFSVIQKISGRKTLSLGQEYLEVLDEDKEAANALLKF